MLVGRRLDDGESGNAIKAETPGVGIYFFRKACKPRFGVEGAEGFQETPVVVMIVLDGPERLGFFAEDDERSVGA